MFGEVLKTDELKQKKLSNYPDGLSDGSNSSSICYSASCSSDSYVANWENYVMPDGTLFYAEYSSANAMPWSLKNEEGTNIVDHSLGHSSKRSGKKNKFNTYNEPNRKTDDASNPVNQWDFHNDTFSESSQKSDKEFIVMINPDNRLKLGRRCTLSESLLGISLRPFPDSLRLMVAGFIGNLSEGLETQIKEGDWFKTLNGISVTVHNIDDLLLQYTELKEAVLAFQTIPDENEISNNSNKLFKIENFETFAKLTPKIFRPTSLNDVFLNKGSPFILLVLNEFDANGGGEIIFSYPDKKDNDLLDIKGSFITLKSILKTELSTNLLSTTVVIKQMEWNVNTYSNKKALIIFALSSTVASLKDSKLKTAEFLQNLGYFREDTTDFLEFVKTDLKRVCQVYESKLRQTDNSSFATMLPESRIVSLPKEAQLRILDALNEMEAMDYRDWNEEPLNSHREFLIYGSVLFYKSFVLANLLPVAHLAAVESFLRCRGVFEFIELNNVHDLIIWNDIALCPMSGRFILAVSCRDKLTLAVILESSNSTLNQRKEKIELNNLTPPSLFYIEEIQDTLDHLKHGGIESLAKAWIYCNKRPEVAAFSHDNQKQRKKKTDGSSVIKASSTFSEDYRIAPSTTGSSIHSLTHSEDSNQKLDDCDSDSDWNGFPDKTYNRYEGCQGKDNFLKEVFEITATRIAAGEENVLINYVHLDLGAGIILSSPEINCGDLIDKFKRTCNLIHTVLQNTKRFRRLLSQGCAKTKNQKSLVAIKEHGVLISFQNCQFWIIGRLFALPTRELYVCHKADVPQNLVELAYRLSFNMTHGGGLIPLIPPPLSTPLLEIKYGFKWFEGPQLPPSVKDIVLNNEDCEEDMDNSQYDSDEDHDLDEDIENKNCETD